MLGGVGKGVETSAELRAQADSLIENNSAPLIENNGALRSSMNRIEVLEGYRRLLRDLLHECRRALIRQSNAPLVNRINKLLKETLD
jgi:hypothetical protein